VASCWSSTAATTSPRRTTNLAARSSTSTSTIFDTAAAQLDAAGVEWISVEDRAKGRFGTFADPDGNYLQIIEWKKDA
jgi:hypothetical protein